MLVCIDTSIFINASNASEKGAEASRRLLERVKEGRVQAVISTITLAELLNGAYRLGSQAAARMKRNFEAYKLSGSIISPLNEDLADKVGELSAKHNSRIRPDVIIVASALLSRVSTIVTRDLEHFSKFKTEINILPPEKVLQRMY